MASADLVGSALGIALMRVALLLPVIVCAAMITRSQGGSDGTCRPPLLPWFAVVFIGLAAFNSTSFATPWLQDVGSELSRGCLVVAIAAIGMKTDLRSMAAVGLRPILLMIGESLFLAALALVLWRVLGS